MTPCEKLGYKVGDKFTFVEELPPAIVAYCTGFQYDQVIVLYEDTGDDIPVFSGDNSKYRNAGYKPGAFVHLDLLNKVEV